MTTPAAPVQKSDPLAALPRLDRHKPKCGPVRKSKSSRWRAYVLIGVHVLVGIHIVQWLMTGTTVTPVEPSEAGYLLDAGKLNTGFVLFLVLILGTLVFGRWFCGWGCHVVALQDLSAWLLGRIGLRPRPVRSRLLVLAPFVVAFHMFFWGQLQRWWYGVANPPIDAEFTTTELWERFPGPLMGVLTFVVVGFLIVWWLGAKGFCNFGCPYGAFFAVADRFAPGKIKVTSACDACGHCTSVCTSNVRVHEEVAIHKMVVDPACMKCLDCVSVCPKDALYFGLARPKPFARSQQKIKARADLTWPEELLVAGAALLATVAFRGAWFHEGIPLLMAVGLGVLTAASALVLWRLLRRPDVTFQYTPLKQAGHLRRAGRWFVAGGLGWLLLTLVTGIGRYHVYRAGETERVLVGRDQPERRRAQLLEFASWLDGAARWAPMGDPDVHKKRGLARRDLAVQPDGTLDEALLGLAEQDFRRALELDGRMVGAMLPLTDLLNLRGQLGEAEMWLQRVLVLQPGNAQAQFRLDRLRQMRGK